VNAGGGEVRVPWWGRVSALAAPVLLIGGWTVAARMQDGAFDPVVQTISALAAQDADSSWVMTAAIAGTGLCHLVTALALRQASTVGRWWYAAGGLATTGVALFPLPAQGSSPGHVVTATAAFGLLATWPAVERLAARSRHAPANGVPRLRGLRPAVVAVGSVLLLGTLAWFAAEAAAGSDRVGVSERAAAGAQALWPLLVVLGGQSVQSGAKGGSM